MNIFALAGRLVSDPELTFVTKKSDGTEIALCQFALAVDNPRDRENPFWFYGLKAWGVNATNISEFCQQGDQIIVHGTIQPSSFTPKDSDQRVYRTDYIVDRFDFGAVAAKNIESKKAKQAKRTLENLGDEGMAALIAMAQQQGVDLSALQAAHTDEAGIDAGSAPAEPEPF